jgi:hypothetical protein
MEHSIEKYLVKGNLYTWEFKERNPNMKCWNFTADKIGCDSLIELLELMNISTYPSRKTIKAANPTSQIAVPNNRNTQWQSKNSIDLTHLKSESGIWSIDVKRDSIEIKLDVPKLKEFQQAIEKIRIDKGDFAIGDMNDNNILYFWRNPKK